jgi:steroid 5-alpha reductase family enzyme
MRAAALLIGLAAMLSLMMTFAWAVALRSGRSGSIDAIWSFAIGAAGVAAALAPLHPGATLTARQIVTAALAAIWSLRLGLHIVQRTRGGGDDPRYAKLRQDWGNDVRRKLLLFLQVQAGAAFFLALSVLAAAHNPAPWPGPGDFLGIAVLVIAIVGEGVADRQLARFRADPARRQGVCDIGLWGLSRHPNYFSQWLGWVAYALIAIDPAGGYGWGWLALSGPALMYWLLVHVSGIPPLEAHMLQSRGDAFRAYQDRVNAFWPGPARPGLRGAPRAGSP